MADANFWKAFTEQSPGIVAVIVVVVLFLRYGVKPMLEYLQQQDERWMKFLEQQGAQNNAALSRMSTEIGNNTAAIQALTKMMAEHDAWTRGAVETMGHARIGTRRKKTSEE